MVPAVGTGGVLAIGAAAAPRWCAFIDLDAWPVVTGRWYAYAVWCAMLQTWHDMPGPWWVKILLVAVCLAIPGPQDEIALILLTRVFRAWRARQAASLTTANDRSKQPCVTRGVTTARTCTRPV
jgi:hypothetical protein